MYADDFLYKKLDERKKEGSFRQLKLPEGKIDFCSNDYLGIVHDNKLTESNPRLNDIVGQGQLLPDLRSGAGATGSTGSRLLAGNYQLIEQTEKQIASFHQSDTALIFNSGYDANIGSIAAIAQRGDTILYDALCHASIRDGIRLSFAESFSFAHNDMEALAKRLQHTRDSKGNIIVVTETVFSMDGDLCPLNELVALCEKYSAHLVVDEAHATGVIGERGEGLVQHLGLQNKVFARMHSFGKACGCHGAVILGSATLRDYLINFSRSFVYSTSLPPHAVAMISEAYKLFPTMQAERKQLQGLIQQFQSANISYEKLSSQTAIQVVIIPGNENVKTLAEKLQENNLDVRPILYPTVPKGKERLRIVLHAFNTNDEVGILTEMLK